jgi:hypothetical protein
MIHRGVQFEKHDQGVTLKGGCLTWLVSGCEVLLNESRPRVACRLPRRIKGCLCVFYNICNFFAMAELVSIMLHNKDTVVTISNHGFWY